MNLSRVLRSTLALGVLVLAAGCVQAPKPIYLWGDFPRQQYETLQRSGASSADQISAMQEQTERARGTDALLPPGFRAHLGMLHLSSGNPGEARTLWEAEKVAFPESAPYMNQLLKRLSAPDDGAAPK